MQSTVILPYSIVKYFVISHGQRDQIALAEIHTAQKMKFSIKDVLNKPPGNFEQCIYCSIINI